ncbi:hypothetical protein NST84_09695 [Paenibacillus sp. FSL R7-0345]|uniref:hypothetical protein n=1 Tax=Paenibacillus sp. FSL R7-0345 TaxID=2954535 RepID=UPI00315B0385
MFSDEESKKNISCARGINDTKDSKDFKDFKDFKDSNDTTTTTLGTNAPTPLLPPTTLMMPVPN